MGSTSKSRVAYFYDEKIGEAKFTEGHPMKPFRLTLTNTLVGSYDLYKKMQVYQCEKAGTHDMAMFHSQQYVDFLKEVKPDSNDENPETKNDYIAKQKHKFRLELDCPVFDGIWDYCATYTGASLQAAHLLNQKEHDIIINWSGGLHHAKRENASGFCYINDIVLAIISLLNHHRRVLYIDIDVHHGDAVQEAFYKTDRVMTLSFHKYGETFFPMTGQIDEVGIDAGSHYSINVPMKKGMDDAMYQHIFEPVVTNVVSFYRPDAIVLQCGADSLAEDRLGCFNLTVHGHGKCVQFVKSLNIPMMVLGGGGYTPRNVARCWTYETAVCLDEDIPNDIPQDYHYIEHFGPEFNLNYKMVREVPNENTRQDLDIMQKLILDLLKKIAHAPSVEMKEIHDPSVPDDDEDDNSDPDVRDGQRQREKRVDHDAEFYDNEEESEGCSYDSDYSNHVSNRNPMDDNYSTRSWNSSVPSEDASKSGTQSSRSSISSSSEVPEQNQMNLASPPPPISEGHATTSKTSEEIERKQIKKLNSKRYQMHLRIKEASAKQASDNNIPGHCAEELDAEYVSSSEDEDKATTEDDSGDEGSGESDTASEYESGDEDALYIEGAETYT